MKRVFINITVDMTDKAYQDYERKASEESEDYSFEATEYWVDEKLFEEDRGVEVRAVVTAVEDRK